MTNDPDDELPPLPEDVGVDVLTARMEMLGDIILRGVSRIEQLETSVTQHTAATIAGTGKLERQVHRFTVHSLWSFFGGIFLAALALLGMGVAIGQQWGRQEGYDEASTENAAASWGATNEGRWAYAFAQTGDLAMIRNCSNKGWEVRNGTCSPQAGPDHMIYGWHLIGRTALPVRHKARKRP
jgi:hypothetical protein